MTARILQRALHPGARHRPLLSHGRAGFLLRNADFGSNLIFTAIIAGAVIVSAITAREVVARRSPIQPLLNTQRVPTDPTSIATPVSHASQQPARPLPPESAPALVTIARAPTSPAPPSTPAPSEPAASSPTNPTTPSFPGLVQFGSPGFVGPPPPDNFFQDPALRWFHGRPIRPAKILWMTVTAYSPDWRSCGDSADSRTATMHCVTTNAHLLIAADPQVLAYGTMLSVPGYGLPLSTTSPSQQTTLPEEPVVPVLDCGGAIKGFRLDVLYPTHDQARQWGIQFLPVTVWEYADGQPSPNPRRLR